MRVASRWPDACLCLCLWLAAGTPVGAQQPPALDADSVLRIEAILDGAIAGGGIKAVLAGVAVGEGEPLLLARGTSMTGVPASPEMHFRSGSVAIAYLGTVLLQLQDKGVLDSEDSLARWFPDYPEADSVTLSMLIGGTSGYADYVTDDGFLRSFYADPFRDWQPEELIAIGLGRPMVCDPGACWSYAHTNFVILGQVLEKAAGKPLDGLIRESIVDPLGLAGTRSDQTATIPEPVLHAFDAERGRYEEFDLLESRHGRWRRGR